MLIRAEENEGYISRAFLDQMPHDTIPAVRYLSLGKGEREEEK